MSTSAAHSDPRAIGVEFTEDELVVLLGDAHRLAVSLAWFPRLLHATSDQRPNWQLLGDGAGIHWPDVDEDVSVDGLLRGAPSVESGDQHPD